MGLSRSPSKSYWGADAPNMMFPSARTVVLGWPAACLAAWLVGGWAGLSDLWCRGKLEGLLCCRAGWAGWTGWARRAGLASCQPSDQPGDLLARWPIFLVRITEDFCCQGKHDTYGISQPQITEKTKIGHLPRQGDSKLGQASLPSWPSRPTGPCLPSYPSKSGQPTRPAQLG